MLSYLSYKFDGYKYAAKKKKINQLVSGKILNLASANKPKFELLEQHTS